MLKPELQQITEAIIDLADRSPDRLALREVLEKFAEYSYCDGMRDGVELAKAVSEGRIQ